MILKIWLKGCERNSFDLSIPEDCCSSFAKSFSNPVPKTITLASTEIGAEIHIRNDSISAYTIEREE